MAQYSTRRFHSHFTHCAMRALFLVVALNLVLVLCFDSLSVLCGNFNITRSHSRSRSRFLFPAVVLVFALNFVLVLA